MRRVVVTGMGIVSPIGNGASEVTRSLRDGRSGLGRADDFRARGFRSHVWGKPHVDLASIDRRASRWMGDTAAYAFLSMQQAVADAKLTSELTESPRTGLIVGSGAPSTVEMVKAAESLVATGSPRRIGPFAVPRMMSSTCAASLATWWKIRGVSYSMSSACATSAHCIGHAADLIRAGRQDRIFAGGAEAVDWTLGAVFDAMGALSSRYNDTPERASRPFDRGRDGFVIGGGGGIVVLEALEHAEARGATIYAELVGYGASSDGADMVTPSGEGAVRCLRDALSTVDGAIDYINAHATSTPVGDTVELRALREVFGDRLPPINSTKSLTGHTIGAAGVHEAIYAILQLNEGFIAATANLDEPDAELGDAPVARRRIDGARMERVLSSSFGFGGTNAVLVFQRWRGRSTP